MKRPHTSLEDQHAWRGRFWWGPCALIRYVVLVGLEAFLGMYLMSGGCGLSSSIQGAETGMIWPFLFSMHTFTIFSSVFYPCSQVFRPLQTRISIFSWAGRRAVP